MKISIEKPKESIWKFPCLGQLSSGTKVYFTDWELGIVVESDDDYKIGYMSAAWNMNKFTPIDINGNELNKSKSINWDKAELPIWFTHRSGSVNIISQKGDNGLAGTELCEDGGIIWAAQYDNIDERDKLLNSLEILPKGTKIIIEL
jgi:hypothetical protein